MIKELNLLKEKLYANIKTLKEKIKQQNNKKKYN